MMNVWVIITLVVAIVSLVLAIIGNTIASPVYLILMAIWLTLWFGVRSPW